MRSHIKNLAIPGLMLTLSACSSAFEPSVKSMNLDSNSVVASLPSLSQTLVQTDQSNLRTCLGRGSDAAFSQSDNGNISIALISTGVSSDSDDVGNSESSGETEMSGRTPGVLIARELLFRTCEFSMNYQLSKQEALQLYLKTLDTVSKGWDAEIQITKITIGETVSISDTDSASTAASSEAGVTGNTPVESGATQSTSPEILQSQ